MESITQTMESFLDEKSEAINNYQLRGEKWNYEQKYRYRKIYDIQKNKLFSKRYDSLFGNIDNTTTLY